MELGYTILYVESVPQTIEFYEKAFGLERKFLHEDQYGELKNEATTCLAFASNDLASSHGFQYRKQVKGGESPPFEIAFIVKDVEAAYQQAIAGGCVGLAAPAKKPWGQTVAYVKDLNGFIVELCTKIAG
ncbi:Lactoylglutathione lyase [Zopfochytrium polystomum]|nr:Lactoylglutathione lyase [Zopfochytrium polystomum]